jgi:hypothetical protein
MNDTAADIERWLLDLASWVPASAICERYGIPERQLRADGRRPGLLDEFAVSSTRNGHNGYIHHKYLPTEEWLPIKHRLRKHAVAELRRVKVWTRARARVLSPAPAPAEAHTGQLVMSL